MKKIDLILFDLDGTLVDSQQDIISSVNVALKTVGLLEKSTNEISSYIGTGVADLILKSLGEKNAHRFDEALAVFKEHYKEHFADTSVLYPGVKELLEHYRDKKKAVISNKRRDFVVLTLKALGVDNFFEDVLGGDMRDCVKPDPCPIIETMRKSGVGKEKTIMIGDMDVDVKAGKEAGVLTCAVTYGIGKREDIEPLGPDYLIDSISELKNIIC